MIKGLVALCALSACGLGKKNETENKRGDIELFPVADLDQVAEQAIEPTLIGGTVADPKDWPASMYADMGGARCTATIVGERALLIAAHCVDNGAAANFTLNGTRYTSVCTHSKEYAGNATADYTLCLIDKKVEGIPYEKMNQDANLLKVGDKITLTGFGCIKPGGGGGNDGLYRIGEATITQLPFDRSNDIVTKGSAALCFGDSGGPSFQYLDRDKKDRVVLAINSRGDIRAISYLSALHTAEGKRFLNAWAEKNGQKLCGVHADAVGCRGAKKPEPSPSPSPSPLPPTKCADAYKKVGACLFENVSFTMAPAACYQAAGFLFQCLEEKYN